MFALKDSVLTVVKAQLLPSGNGAVPVGTPVRLLSHNNVSLDPGGKSTYIKGAKMLPITIVNGTAEPKLEIDFADGPELWAARNAMGGIGSTIIVTLSFARL